MRPFWSKRKKNIPEVFTFLPCFIYILWKGNGGKREHYNIVLVIYE